MEKEIQNLIDERQRLIDQVSMEIVKLEKGKTNISKFLK